MDGNYTRNSMFGIKFELKLENRLFVSEMRSVCLGRTPSPKLWVNALPPGFIPLIERFRVLALVRVPSVNHGQVHQGSSHVRRQAAKERFFVKLQEKIAQRVPFTVKSKKTQRSRILLIVVHKCA